ncbi:MAG: hypothetical protein WBA46_01795 [Thermomicrobiales bacterium]
MTNYRITTERDDIDGTTCIRAEEEYTDIHGDLQWRTALSWGMPMCCYYTSPDDIRRATNRYWQQLYLRRCTEGSPIIVEVR